MLWSRRAFVGSAFAAAFAAAAAEFPSRPITLVQPFPPGGASDALVRLVGERAARVLRVPLIVDSKPGAGGNVAALSVLRAPADGYTVFVSHMGIHSINPYLFEHMPFDPSKDFRPVISLAEVKGVLVVAPDSPARTMADLARLGRTREGGLSYGSSGIGTGSHLLGEMFAAEAGAHFVHVPYQTAARALIDLVEGRLDFVFTALQSTLPLIRSGRLRALAVSVPERVADKLPNVPSTAEAGFPGVVSATWYGLFVPVATPDGPVLRLGAVFANELKQPEVASALAEQGLYVTAEPPDALNRRIAVERERYRTVIGRLGIKMQ